MHVWKLIRNYYCNWAAQSQTAYGLAIFRIVYGLILFADVRQMYRFRHLIFDRVPYLEPIEIDLGPFLLLWLAAIIGMIVGWQTRIMTCISFCGSILTFATFRDYEYHLDHILHSVDLLLPLLPLERCWSIDRYLAVRNGTAHADDGMIHPLAPAAIIIAGLALPYLDSVLWKIGQMMWLTGHGVWLPCSLPNNTYGDPYVIQWLLNQPLLYKAANWATLLLEAGFIVLAYFRITRIWVVLPLGISLHLGIYWVFPIPYFALTMLALYLLLIPENWYAAAVLQINRGFGRLAATAVTSIADDRHYKFSHGKGPVFLGVLGTVLLTLTGLQAVFMLETPLLLNRPIYSDAARSAIHSSTGLCCHGVFLDHHFNGYDQVIALSYIHPDGKQEWLPLTDPGGQMDRWALGRLWAKWGFRGNSPYLMRPILADTIRDYTAYWIHKRALPLEGATFVVMVKRYVKVEPGEPNALLRQVQQPWHFGGTAVWRDKTCEIDMMDFEQLGREEPGAPDPATILSTRERFLMR